MINEPLGLPQGSVRAILSIIIMVGLLVVILMDNPNAGSIKDIALVIIGFYFGSRPQGATEFERYEMAKRKGE